MSALSKRSNTTLAISANWQALFIVVTLLGWLSTISTTLLSFAASGYLNIGTWIFQITTWLLPLAFFAVAFYLLAHYRHIVQRVFMACLALTIGMGAYGAVSLGENHVWYNYIATPPATNDTSWWAAFGNEWAVMIGCLVFYSLILYGVTRKARS